MEQTKKPLSEMTLQELWQQFPIVLTAHRDCWSVWYAEERDRLAALLPRGTALSHIGSTAVSGIWAKPIVDILAEVPENTDMEDLRAPLENAGWRRMSRSGKSCAFNKGYTENGFAERVFHLHIRFPGDCDELLFRDYLNGHPEAAREYEALKLSLWKRYEHDRDGYTEAKTPFIAACMKAAREERKDGRGGTV